MHYRGMDLSFFTSKKSKPSRGGSSPRNRTTLTPFVPREVVAGMARAASKNPRHEGVLNEVIRRYGEEAVQVVWKEVGGEFFYIAAPARLFDTPEPHLCNPLTAAFPGEPGHQGDGLYVAAARVSGMAVAVHVQDAQVVNAFCGSVERLQQKAEELRAPVFPCEAGGLEWLSAEAYSLRQSRKTFLAANISLGAVALVLCALVAAFGMKASQLEAAALKAVSEAKVHASTTAQSINTALNPPPDETLEMVASVEGVVRRFNTPQAGVVARVVSFSKDAGGVGFELRLPVYATSESFEHLQGIEVSRDASGITISKTKAAHKAF